MIEIALGEGSFLQPQRRRCPARSIRREAATFGCASATSKLLNFTTCPHYMSPSKTSDPKPMYAAWHGEAKCAVVEADSDAMKSTICNSLEMQRRMTWIGLDLREISVRYGLNFGGAMHVEALPKPL
ncbi:MAG: hypothetical protein IPF55_18560 [Rhodoferax sp.]|nr:hypothetical protein [Rhodoferax sp.]